eukprot:3566783-Rhodomonas_salina.1
MECACNCPVVEPCWHCVERVGDRQAAVAKVRLTRHLRHMLLRRAQPEHESECPARDMLQGVPIIEQST